MKWKDLPQWIRDCLAVLFMVVGALCMVTVLVGLFGDLKRD